MWSRTRRLDVGKFLDIGGLRFEHLTALYPAAQRVERGRQFSWWCRCDCGNEKLIASGKLRGGSTKSCGCLGRGQLGQRSITHGATRGYTRTPEYRAWESMIRRCEMPSQPNFPRYGGRGITVCPEWRESFETFLLDMGQKPSPKHTLDRIDNDQGYSAENCRWATWTQQRTNQGRYRSGTTLMVTR